MKRLILDRGFLDGEAISMCKKEYGIDTLIPIHRNMDIYENATALFRLPDIDWIRHEESAGEGKEPIRPKPEALVNREKKRQEKPAILPEETRVYREAAVIDQFRSWSSCTVPLSVVANKEIYADGHEKIWLLIDTKDVKAPREKQLTDCYRREIPSGQVFYRSDQVYLPCLFYGCQSSRFYNARLQSASTTPFSEKTHGVEPVVSESQKILTRICK